MKNTHQKILIVSVILISIIGATIVYAPNSSGKGRGKKESIKYLRLYQAEEVTAEYPPPPENEGYTLIASFTVYPDNPSNNAILYCNFYFEAKIDAPTPAGANLMLRMKNADLRIDAEQYTQIQFNQRNQYQWEHYAVERQSSNMYSAPIPNQSSYTIEAWYRGGHGTPYLRNLNVILTMIDGLQPSS